MMLEQLRLEPGHRILEVGAGTGYNAALMAAVTGEAGQVTAVDIDADLVGGARKHLAAAGAYAEVGVGGTPGWLAAGSVVVMSAGRYRKWLSVHPTADIDTRHNHRHW
jgi:protein-L-isoaspartate O-methyltransferase